jgi:ribosome-binding protein aMBF1 (putative translation factor)
MKPPDLPTHEEVLAGDLSASYQREWARVALTRAVAMQVIAYRAKHGLSQAALAARLKMTQPAVARLESAEHNFARAMLLRVSKALED